jgi:integrase
MNTNGRNKMRIKLPRYVQKVNLAGGRVEYRFNPPQSLVNAGVVKREMYGSSLTDVRHIAKISNALIDDYRKKVAEDNSISANSKLEDLVNVYYLSNDFNMLREETKADYKYFLSVLCASIGNKKYKDVTTKVAKWSYEDWVKRGISLANHVATCASRVFNYAIDMEYTYFNPFTKIKRKAEPQRRVVWEHDDVIRFLDVAYADYSTRNIGLIIQMAYEWCQRLGDMRNLEWDSIDFDKKVLLLEQSKRRAEVFLPISEGLMAMLQDQHEDFGFQGYVAPHIMPNGKVFGSYSMQRLSKNGRAVMRKAGLSEKLRLMDLRRTGVVQMVNKGVALPNIMSVTGHTNVASVKPYLKNTYTSANKALTQRNVSVQSNTVSNIESDTL